MRAQGPGKKNKDRGERRREANYWNTAEWKEIVKLRTEACRCVQVKEKEKKRGFCLWPSARWPVPRKNERSRNRSRKEEEREVTNETNCNSAPVICMHCTVCPLWFSGRQFRLLSVSFSTLDLFICYRLKCMQWKRVSEWVSRPI